MSSLKKKNLRTKKFTTKLKPSLGEGAFLVAQTVKNLPATQETQVQTLHWEDPLEKGMATHSGILAWRIPRTEKPGRLQSTSSQESDTTDHTHMPHKCSKKHVQY